MKYLIKWFKEEESGQSMVEYGLLIALIAVVVMVVLLTLGPKIANMFNNISNNLD